MLVGPASVSLVQLGPTVKHVLRTSTKIYRDAPVGRVTVSKKKNVIIIYGFLSNAECPQCYRELQTLFYNTSFMHNGIESSLFNVLVKVSPYDSRLQEEQEDVEDIAQLGQIYTEHQSQLKAEVVRLTALVNNVLSEDLTELQENLDFLKTTSTPVFIQALVFEELTNRTIAEFLMTQNEITKLIEFYIPNITQSLSAINNSHSLTTDALESLIFQLQLLTTQTSDITLLVSELMSITNSALVTAYDIQALNENIEDVTNIIQENLTYIQHCVNSLSQLVRVISMNILDFSVSIMEQVDYLPNTPSLSSIQELQTALSSSQSTAEHINIQLSMKKADISHLWNAVTKKEREVDSFSYKLQEFSSQTRDLEEQVQTTNNMTMAAVNDAEYKIHQAGVVLENLQNFSDDTFEVGRRANEALSSVEGLTTEANTVLENVAAVQQNVSEMRLTLHNVTGNTYDADNITGDAQMVGIISQSMKQLLNNLSFAGNS